MFKNITVRKAYTMLLLCGAGWAASTIIIKIYIGSLEPFHLMFGRFLFAFFLVFLMKPEKLLKSSPKEATHALILGILLFAAFATGILSLKYTTASKSGFLIALPVIFVPLIQLLIHRKMPNQWVGLSALISLVGLYLISGMDGLGFNFGDLLAILSSVSYAIYIIILGAIAKSIDEYTLVQFQLITMSALALIFAIFLEGFQLQAISASLVPIVLTGFLGTAMTLYFQVHAQRVASPESVSLLLLSEPVLTFLMAWGILHETITLTGLFGGTLIITAMVIAIVKKI